MFLCGGVSGNGVKGEASPPTLCQNMRYTLCQQPQTGSHLSSGEPDGSQEPLLLWELFFFPSGLKTQLCQAALPELVAPPPGTAHNPPAQGESRSDMGNVLPPSSPTALRGSIQPWAQPCSDQEQAAQSLWGQARDRVLPWHGQCQNEWL